MSKNESAKAPIAQSSEHDQPVDVAKLDETFGTEARDEILSTFVQYTPVLLQRLATGIQDRDEKTARDVAHQLKGMSSSIYADELLQHSLAIERVAKTDPVDWTTLQSSLPALEVVYQKVRLYLDTVISIK